MGYAKTENRYVCFESCGPCERLSFQCAVRYPRALRNRGGRAYILMGLWLPFSGAFFRATTCRITHRTPSVAQLPPPAVCRWRSTARDVARLWTRTEERSMRPVYPGRTLGMVGLRPAPPTPWEDPPSMGGCGGRC